MRSLALADAKRAKQNEIDVELRAVEVIVRLRDWAF